VCIRFIVLGMQLPIHRVLSVGVKVLFPQNFGKNTSILYGLKE
jgi:hypothetical protein